MEKFYVTTAIDYVNAEPHVGHLYQKVIADILSRWHKSLGEDVFFLTGTDEHGQKIFNAAKEQGLTPQQLVDRNSKKFKESWKLFNINPDRFIRTTDKDHIKTAQEITKKVYDKGDIYKGVYEGLYCEGCEAYLTEKDLVNGECPYHKKIPTKLKENTYFFRLSRYQNKLLELYKKNPNFILPLTRKKEIINRVKEGLKDLSITRTSFKWGIPFSIDKNHITYVWWEALLSYISGIEYPNSKFKKYWPADIQLLGVDNGWFHTVIFPALLMSADIKPSKTIFIHGFLTFNKQKISKSLGNVISPKFLSEKYGVDGLRYFLAREIPFGQDGDFSEEALKNRINNELANELGNLISRTLTLSKKLKGIKKHPLELKFDIKDIASLMNEYKITEALNKIWRYIQETNKYINQNEPWKLEGKELEKVLYNCLESIRKTSILLWPFIPETCEKIQSLLDIKNQDLTSFDKPVSSYRPKAPEILFKKIK